MSDATWQGFGEHDRGGSLKIAAEQIGSAGHLEPRGRPVLVSRADFGEFQSAPVFFIFRSH